MARGPCQHLGDGERGQQIGPIDYFEFHLPIDEVEETNHLTVKQSSVVSA
jgi:hypothetical protein